MGLGSNLNQATNSGDCPFFNPPTTPSVSLRQKGARQTGRTQRPQPESTPDWDPAQAGGAH